MNDDRQDGRVLTIVDGAIYSVKYKELLAGKLYVIRKNTNDLYVCMKSLKDEDKVLVKSNDWGKVFDILMNSYYKSN